MANTEEMLEFLEQTLPQMVTPTTDALYAVAVDKDGNPKTVYYHCSPLDRWKILGSILYDALIAFIRDNKTEIKEILESEDEEE